MRSRLHIRLEQDARPVRRELFGVVYITAPNAAEAAAMVLRELENE